MKIANTLFRWFIGFHYRHLDHSLRYPHDTQRQVLTDLLRAAADTEWGRAYDYASIRTPRTFSQRVPLTDYDDLKPFIERMMRGERDVLWHGAVTQFSKSSGTTSDRSKFIPVSREALEGCHLKGAHDMMAAWYHRNPESMLFDGKLMAMGGTLKPYPEHPETVVGDVSALMTESMPFYARLFFAPTLDTALMDDWEQKIARMTDELLTEDLRSLSGVPTWTLVLFRQLLERTKREHLLDVFPNFELYIHGGVSFTPYREQFEQFFPSDKVQFWGAYNASEGFFAGQLENDRDDFTLFLDNGVYYEFIPIETFTDPEPTTLSLEEVELGQNYALVISTNAGLWRYVIGDTVRFTSLEPYRIVITGRTKHFINVFGEEVVVDNTDRALALTTAATRSAVREYTVAPIFFEGLQGKGGHEWLIEFSTPPDDPAAFAALLDANLQSVNSDYEAKRAANLALAPLRLTIVPTGTFHAWLHSRGKVGGQHKVPRLSNERTHLEEVLAFA